MSLRNGKGCRCVDELSRRRLPEAAATVQRPLAFHLLLCGLQVLNLTSPTAFLTVP
jgi:hypothetical protein